ncbi:hypothetical protein CHUAL_001552 [Chamberlinius hualienensis]
MASFSDNPFRSFEDEMRLKRTARKSTFVPKKFATVPVASSNSITASSPVQNDGGERLLNPRKLNDSVKMKEKGSINTFESISADDGICHSESEPVEKFTSVEEMQTVRIRKLQTARKSFQCPTPSSKLLEKRKEGLSSSVSTRTSSVFSPANDTVNNQRLGVHSKQLTMSTPTIKNLQISLRNVPNNGADLKIPLVKLERDIKRVYRGSKMINEHIRKEVNILDCDDEIAIPAARGREDEPTHGLMTRYPLQLINKHEHKTDIMATRQTLQLKSYNGDGDLKFSNDIQIFVSPRKGENACTDDPYAIELMKLEEQLAAEEDSDYQKSCRAGKRRGRKPKRRRAITYSILQSGDDNATAAFKQDESSKLKTDRNSISVVKSVDVRIPSTNGNIGSKLSLIQHLPNIDVIDDVEFLSFETEDDLRRFVKRNPSYTLDFSGKNGATRFRGSPITLTKTKDFTKIKGWRSKMFASDVQPIEDRNAEVDRSRLEKALLEVRAENGISSISQATVKDEHIEESLDLDIDVVDDETQRNIVEESRNENDSAVTHHSHFKEETFPSLFHSLGTDRELTPGILSSTAPGDKVNKSAFVSDYLDEFLRNNSELKTSLSVVKTNESNNDKIDTKVVWPTQAISPNSEMAKIKPPPFSTRKPQARNLTKELTKTINTASISSSRDVVPIEKARNIVKLVPTVKSSPPVQSSNSSFNLSSISLARAHNAAQAVIEPRFVHHLLTVRKAKVVKFELPVAWNRVVINTRKELKENFLSTVTRAMAEVAVTACDLTRSTSMPFKSSEITAANDKKDSVQSGSTKFNENVIEMQKSGKNQSEVECAEEMFAQPPSPYPASVDPENNGSNVGCDKPYCRLGCVCESIKVPKRRRKHCGKLICMLNCTCKTNDNNAATPEQDPSFRHKRQIRLPARLKDSFLWNGGRDLPLNFDFDMSVHRKSELKDDTSRLLWKEGAKWNDPYSRVKKRSVNRVNLKPFKHIAEAKTLNNKYCHAGDNLECSSSRLTPCGNVIHNKYSQLDRTKSLFNTYSGSESYKRSVMVNDTANLLPKPVPENCKSLSNQRKEYQRRLYSPATSTPTRGMDGTKNVEPNAMLPHDWRFVSKSPEENPELQERRRLAEDAARASSTSRNFEEELEYKFYFKRLSAMVYFWTMKLKARNPDLAVNSHSCVLAVATFAIKRLQQQEIELVNQKRQLVAKRATLFNTYKKHLAGGFDVEKQKLLTRALSVRLLACCAKSKNPKVFGFLNSDARNVVASLFNKPNMELRRFASDVVNNNSKLEHVDEHLSDYSAADIDENLLEEPKVVIENDLDDEDGNTEVGISTVAGTRVSNFVEKSSRNVAMVSSRNSSAQSSQEKAKLHMLPTFRKWRKLMPKLTVAKQLNFFSGNASSCINHRVRATNSTFPKSAIFGSASNLRNVSTDFNKETKVYKRVMVTNGNANVGQMNPTIMPITTFKSTNGANDMSSQKRFIKIVSGMPTQNSSRIILLPMEAKEFEKQFSIIDSPIKTLDKSGTSARTSGMQQPPGISSNRQYGTILLSVNMLPGTNAVTDQKSIGEMSPGIILQPIVSGPVFPICNADDRKGIVTNGKMSCTNVPNNVKPQLKRAIKDPNGTNTSLQSNLSKDMESVDGSLSSPGCHNEIATAAVDSSPVINSLNLNGDSIFNNSLKNSSSRNGVVTSLNDEKPFETRNNLVSETLVDLAIDDYDEQIANAYEFLEETEEMPKIINLVTITEDEFRCKDEMNESLTS